MSTRDSEVKQNLSKNVYDVLLERLLNSDLVPGEILNRRAVAEELGTSVAPVLEAMLQLESEGFLESIPRKGTIVSPIREKDVRGQLIVREALECQAVRMYCGRPVEENESRLLPVAAEIDNATSSRDRMRRDIDLHKMLIRLTDCDSLVDEYDRIMKVQVFHIMNRFLTEDDKRVHWSHVELVQSLKEPDPDKAERVMREHLRSGKVHFLTEE